MKKILFLLWCICSLSTLASAQTDPEGITGTFTVCMGAKTRLFDKTVDGTWSSDNILVATVDPNTGDVNGITPGSVMIYYIVPGYSNRASVIVTVNQTPSAVTIYPAIVSNTICIDCNIILSDGPAGGTWSSDNNRVASIDKTTGMVIGISNGAANIVYSKAGCPSPPQALIVNPLPSGAIIAARNPIYIGSTITVGDLIGGGTWSSSSTNIATITQNTGIARGISVGTATITYMTAVNGFATAVLTVKKITDIRVHITVGGFSGLLNNMQNKTYAWQQVPNSNNTVTNTSNYLLVASGETPKPAGIDALMNIEWRNRENSCAFGLSGGFGLTAQSPTQLVGMVGPSLVIFGKDWRQIVITGALAGTYVNKLSNAMQAVADQQISYTTPVNIQYYKELKTGIILSITCNPFSLNDDNN